MTISLVLLCLVVILATVYHASVMAQEPGKLLSEDEIAAAGIYFSFYFVSLLFVVFFHPLMTYALSDEIICFRIVVHS